MRSGWIGNTALQRRLLRPDPEAHIIVEGLVNKASDVRRRKDQWGSGAGLHKDADGGVTLRGTRDTILASSITADQGSDSAAGFSAQIELRGASVTAVTEIHKIVAQLDARHDGLEANEVARWALQVFQEVGSAGVGSALTEIRPISSVLYKDATAQGDVPVEVEFEFDYPIKVGAAPEGKSHPVLYVQIRALKADDSAAPNASWRYDSTIGETNTSGNLVRGRILTLIPGETGSANYNVTNAAGVPYIKVLTDAVAAATMTLTDVILADITDTDIEVVAQGTEPAGTSITYENSSDAGVTWYACKDGDIVGVGVLASVARQTTAYHMRATLNPGVGGAVSPVLRALGLQSIKTISLDGLASLGAGGTSFDPVEFVGEIEEVEIKVVRDGEMDFRDVITELTTEHFIGALTFRVSVGHADLARGNWLHLNTYIIDDYDITPEVVTFQCLTPLVHLRVPFPVVDTAATPPVRRPEVYGAQTLKAVYDSIISKVGVSARFRGPGIEDTTTTVTKTVEDSDAKAELDALALIGGGVITSSQGVIKFNSVTSKKPPVQEFIKEEIDLESATPGYRQRIPELFVKHSWDADREKFASEVRVFHAASLTKLETASLDPPRDLNDTVCRWLDSEARASALGQAMVNRLGPGILLWRFRTSYPNPHLELGDRIAVPTEYFTARDPNTERELKGHTWAIGVVQAIHDPMGYGLTLWIQDYADIHGSDQGVDVSYDVEPQIVFTSVAKVAGSKFQIDVRGDAHTRSIAYYVGTTPSQGPDGHYSPGGWNGPYKLVDSAREGTLTVDALDTEPLFYQFYASKEETAWPAGQAQPPGPSASSGAKTVTIDKMVPEPASVEAADASTTATPVTSFSFQGNVLSIANGVASLNLDSRYSQLGHLHDDRYSQLGHLHDDRYSLLGHTHSSLSITDFAEAVDDRVAALILGGTGISWTYDDALGTLTPAVGGLTDAEIAAGAAIAWSKISKAGSSLADLATRSAGDLNSGNLLVARMPIGGTWALTSDLTISGGSILVGGAVVRPTANGGTVLGAALQRWATIYGVNGDFTGPINMNSQKITSLGDPTVDADATNQGWVKSYVTNIASTKTTFSDLWDEMIVTGSNMEMRDSAGLTINTNTSGSFVSTSGAKVIHVFSGIAYVKGRRVFVNAADIEAELFGGGDHLIYYSEPRVGDPNAGESNENYYVDILTTAASTWNYNAREHERSIGKFTVDTNGGAVGAQFFSYYAWGPGVSGDVVSDVGGNQRVLHDPYAAKIFATINGSYSERIVAYRANPHSFYPAISGLDLGTPVGGNVNTPDGEPWDYAYIKHGRFLNSLQVGGVAVSLLGHTHTAAEVGAQPANVGLDRIGPALNHGAIRITGTSPDNAAYGGIAFPDIGRTLMWGNTVQGAYEEGIGWKWYFEEISGVVRLMNAKVPWARLEDVPVYATRWPTNTEAGAIGRGVDTWHTSSDGSNRIYFATNSTTYFETKGSFIFRDLNGATLVELSQPGDFQIISGDLFLRQGGNNRIYSYDTGGIYRDLYIHAAATFFDGHSVVIKQAENALILRGATTGVGTTAYIRFQDSAAANLGYFGLASSSNNDVYLNAGAGSVRIENNTIFSGYGQFGNYIIVPSGSPVYLDGGSNTYIYENAADSVQIVRGGSTGATFNGWGTRFPGSLSLGGPQHAWGGGWMGAEFGYSGSIMYLSSHNNLYILQNAYYNGTNWIRPNAAPSSVIDLWSGQVVIQVAASGVAGASVPWVEALRIDNSARLILRNRMLTEESAGALWLAEGFGDIRFRNSGNIQPYADNTKALGSASLRWNTVHGMELYAHNWCRVSAAGGRAGVYWESGTGAGWHIYHTTLAQDMLFRAASTTVNSSLAFSLGDEVIRGYIHWTTDNQIGFLNQGRNWLIRTYDSMTSFYSSQLSDLNGNIIAGVIISGADPSGTARTGTFWAKV